MEAKHGTGLNDMWILKRTGRAKMSMCGVKLMYKKLTRDLTKLGSEVAQPSVPLDSSTRAALIRRE